MSQTPEQEVVVTMVLRSVELDETAPIAIAVLVAENHPRLYLPVFVTLEEGQDLALLDEAPQADAQERPRLPAVFTLLTSAVGCWVRELVITRIQEGRLISQLHVVDAQGGLCALDIHVVDGLKVALQAGSPIYATQEVLAKAGALFPEGQGESEVMPLLHPEDAAELAELDEALAHSEAMPAPPEESPKKSTEVADGPRSFFGEINLDELTPADFGKYRM